MSAEEKRPRMVYLVRPSAGRRIWNGVRPEIGTAEEIEARYRAKDRIRDVREVEGLGSIATRETLPGVRKNRLTLSVRGWIDGFGRTRKGGPHTSMHGLQRNADEIKSRVRRIRPQEAAAIEAIDREVEDLLAQAWAKRQERERLLREAWSKAHKVGLGEVVELADAALERGERSAI